MKNRRFYQRDVGSKVKYHPVLDDFQTHKGIIVEIDTEPEYAKVYKNDRGILVDIHISQVIAK